MKLSNNINIISIYVGMFRFFDIFVFISARSLQTALKTAQFNWLQTEAYSEKNMCKNQNVPTQNISFLFSFQNFMTID